jgi:hypothetical protein
MSATPPRRRHSPAVYRRRRLVLLLVSLLVIGGVVWLLIAQPWRGAAEPTPASAPSTSTSTPAASPTPEGSASPTEVPATDAPDAEPDPALTPTAEGCVPGDLLVEAVTDQASYAQGQNPQLSIRLVNQGAVDCTLNVGTSAQAFTVTSGSDVWWRSSDCQTEPSDMIVLLSAGQEVTSSTPLTWDRTRSSVDTCQSERPLAPGGGATYRLAVSIGGVGSTNDAAFQLY